MDSSRDACDHSDALARLAALERFYDGPVPPAELAAATAPGGGFRDGTRARGEAAFFAALIRGQIKTIRHRRAEGRLSPALLADLALYRRQRRAWWRRFCRP